MSDEPPVPFRLNADPTPLAVAYDAGPSAPSDERLALALRTAVAELNAAIAEAYDAGLEVEVIAEQPFYRSDRLRPQPRIGAQVLRRL